MIGHLVGFFSRLDDGVPVRVKLNRTGDLGLIEDGARRHGASRPEPAEGITETLVHRADVLDDKVLSQQIIHEDVGGRVELEASTSLARHLESRREEVSLSERIQE